MRLLDVLLISQEYPPETARGGIATYVEQLAMGLNQAGHTVRVLTQSTTDEASEQSRGGVTVLRIPNRHPLPVIRRARMASVAHILGWTWTVDSAVRRLIRQRCPDIIEGPLWDAETLLYSLAPRVPFVIRAQTPRVEVARISGLLSRRRAVDLKLSILLDRLAARRANLLMVNSEANRQTIASDLRIHPDRLRVCYLGLPPRQPSAELAKSDGTVRYLYAGRLEARKGIEYLLAAIPSVMRSVPRARFDIVGRDIGRPLSARGYRDEFLEGADDVSQAATHFHGFVPRPELEALYAACDILVAPSIYESFGLVHLEAMSFGKPVVAFQSGATPEIVKHGETGILIQPNDLDGLIAAMVQLGNTPEERRNMGRRGLDVCRTQFSVDRMIERTVEIYREVISNHSKH